jgi:hypothetical protein
MEGMQPMRKWLIQLGALTVAVALLLAGLVTVGNVTRARLQDLDRYSLAFSEIQCDPPPGQARADFLSEVQYLAGMPGRLRLLDEGVAARLAEAFAAHPWVQRVEQIQILPTHEVRASLVFRNPSLAVKLSKSSSTPSVRVVDEQGVLLPTSAPADGLPTLTVEGKTAPSCAGKPWDTPTVTEASRIAALCQPHKPLRFSALTKAQEGWVLQTPGNSRVIWGRPPGAERTDESPAAQKVQRLLVYCSKYGGLDVADGPYELDVRPRSQAIRRPLHEVK